MYLDYELTKGDIEFLKELSHTHLRYAPHQFKPDYFIPDLDDDAPKYHWGCPPPKRRNEFDF